MGITDLLPWKREEKNKPAIRRDDPALHIASDLDRLANEFWREPFPMPWSRMAEMFDTGIFPHLDLSEGDMEFKVTAEMPGLDENDVRVSFNKGVLSISGEKRQENEVKDRRYHRIERSYGSFRREVEIPYEVEEDKITATFKKGVLTVVLPKSTRPESIGKRIQVIKG